MASKKQKSAFAAPLKEFALGLPGAWKDSPWGETVAKVAKKVFVFFGHDDYADFGMSVKLPQSKHEALSLDYCEPTGYGLGKSGWVSVMLNKAKTKPDVEMLKDWILESYTAVAPKKMLAELEARRLGLADTPAKPSSSTTTTKKKKPKK